jgi:hypothetical protein
LCADSDEKVGNLILAVILKKWISDTPVDQNSILTDAHNENKPNFHDQISASRLFHQYLPTTAMGPVHQADG